ncbi:MAG: threonine synthase, partial [Clostridiales bacterium]|nr:threonine synthase [Clostridiales bacterium]
MRFVSTRGGAPASAAQAIQKGLHPDGGLYVPAAFPALSGDEIAGLGGLRYADRAAAVLGRYLT